MHPLVPYVHHLAVEQRRIPLLDDREQVMAASPQFNDSEGERLKLGVEASMAGGSRQFSDDCECSRALALSSPNPRQGLDSPCIIKGYCCAVPLR
jgi:hypothetical protein